MFCLLAMFGTLLVVLGMLVVLGALGTLGTLGVLGVVTFCVVSLSLCLCFVTSLLTFHAGVRHTTFLGCLLLLSCLAL